MSSSLNSSSSSTESESEESFNEERGEFSGFVPYDDNLELLTTVEEAAKYDAQMAREVEQEANFRQDFPAKWSLLRGKMSKMVFHVEVFELLICLTFHPNELII